MSLVSDTDFLIHQLRLSYLRHADDPYAHRILSLSPNYASNPHIVAAGLDDPIRWPELAIGPSPPVSEDEGGADDEGSKPKASGYPGANLRYTQTIMGPNRSGALGMRTSAKRTSLARSSRSIKADGKGSLLAGASPALGGSPATLKVEVEGPTPDKKSLPKLPEDEQSGAPDNGKAKEKEAEKPQGFFVPKFKGAAEMEARRRQRMAERANALTKRSGVPAAPARAINPDTSSDEADSDFPPPKQTPVEMDSDSGSEMSIPSDFMPDTDDMADEFDPDFAASRPDPSGSSWSATSPSNSSAPDHSPQIVARHQPRLSPVAEALPPARTPSPVRSPAPKVSPGQEESSFFKKRPPPKPIAAKSALTAMLASASGSSNPFSELYGAISGKAETGPCNIIVFFPSSKTPERAMELCVKRDATAEEVIGFALWTYWEDKWQPKLDAGMEGWEDKEGEQGERWKIRMGSSGWIMRIAEEDGEVDEDFPSPDRTGRISKFNFDAYAILEASPAQVAQNKDMEAKIQRRPSRVVATKKKAELSSSNLNTSSGIPGSSAISATTLGVLSGSIAMSTLGPSSHGPQIFLRVRVADTVDAVHVSTTIPVSAGMYMQEALELVCRKRRLNPREYTFLLGDMSMLIPLDRTVASLQGRSDLVLVKKTMLPGLGLDETKHPGRTTDPNASIFKRMSEVPTNTFSSTGDFTTAYKKYTIFKKTPMLVGRQERTLAFDGGYVYIMPMQSKARAMFDSGRTVSYHTSSISSCQQPSKTSAAFRLIVKRDGGHNKRLDFEAESPKLAKEIVDTIKSVRSSTVERSGTVNKSRRSRHVG